MSSYQIESESDKLSNTEQRSPTIKKKNLLFIGIFFFIIFIIAKLPDDKIQRLILSSMKIKFQEAGYLINSEAIRVGIFTGLRLKMTNTDIRSLDNDKEEIKIEHLSVRPHLFSMLMSMKKFSLNAELLGGEIDGMIGLSQTGFTSDLEIENLSIEKASLLKKFILVQLSGILNSNINLTFSANEPIKSSGKLSLSLKNIRLPEQSISGFLLPSIQVSEAQIESQMESGKLLLKDSWIGKDINKGDDIVINVGGDISLNMPVERSQLNLKAVMTLSPKMKEKLPVYLLDSYKCPDGRYGMRFNGMLMSILVPTHEGC